QPLSAPGRLPPVRPPSRFILTKYSSAGDARLYVWNETARVDQRTHERRELGGPVLRAFRDVADDAGRRLQLDLVAALDAVDGLLRFEDGQPDIQRVAIEDSGEALGDDRRRSRSLNRDRGNLAARTAAEVAIGYDDVAGAHAGRELRVEALQRVLSEFRRIDDVAVLSRDDNVRVDILAVFMRVAA